MRTRYKSVLLLICLALISQKTQARKYMRCELTKELLEKHQVDRTFLSSWICLIEHESGGDTRKTTKLSNGSSRYGLFQIDDKKYCRVNNKGGLCNAKCADFLNDDLVDDWQCAKRIFEAEGFKHWPEWRKICKNPQNLPNLRVSCNINTPKSISNSLSLRDLTSRRRSRRQSLTA